MLKTSIPLEPQKTNPDETARERNELFQWQIREQTVLQRRVRIFFSSPINTISVIFMTVIFICAFFPENWLPHDPRAISPRDRNIPLFWMEGGSTTYILGTDHLGRDILSRLIFSVRYSLAVMVCAELVSSLSGILTGLAAGFFGGLLDTIICRLVDIQLAIPTIVLAIALMVVLGPGFINLVLILCIGHWSRITRVVRSSTLSVKTFDYIEASKALGASNGRIVIRHIFPNVISPILVLITLGLASILLTESALSFLGIGIMPPLSTWGGMIGDGRNHLYEAWWISAIPGIAISLTVLSINFLGDGIRDALDPQMQID